MGIAHLVGHVVRTPVFGIAVLTPVVLAGAVAATPSRVVLPAKPAAEAAVLVPAAELRELRAKAKKFDALKEVFEGDEDEDEDAED